MIKKEMKFDKFVKYIKNFVLPDIIRNYKMHEGMLEYEPYWKELKGQCEVTMKILSKLKKKLK